MTLPDTRSTVASASGVMSEAPPDAPSDEKPPFDQPRPPVSVASPEQIRDIAKNIRRHVIRMTGAAGSGHPGGSMSCAEVLATLYFLVMRHDPANPKWTERDRFVLSKGHSAPALYAVLAEAGYFGKDWLPTLRRLDSPLQGHADRNMVPGIEASTGSLGQGLSIANGMALAARLDRRDWRVYALLGDGECDEGQVWEAAMASAHFKLDSVTAIVDCNGLQIDGFTSDIMNLEPLAEKWRAFGWHVLEIDGHDVPQLIDSFELARQAKGRPTVIIARTIKGKGVSFMENNVDFHGKAPTIAQVEQALKELGEA